MQGLSQKTKTIFENNYLGLMIIPTTIHVLYK